VVAISGQVPSKVLGRGAFQDLDLSAVFRDVAAWTTTVHSGSDFAELAALAVKHAADARGVAHLVLPDEVQNLPSEAPAAQPDGRLADRRVRPDETALASAAELIRGATRPVLIVGHGARTAAEEVRTLAERLHAPVLTTFKAKGLVPDHHPLGAGVLGRSGTPVASWLMNEADLLIVVGASFANHTHLWHRIGNRLPWVATQQISTHWLRHTTLTWVERTFGYATARAYTGRTHRHRRSYAGGDGIPALNTPHTVLDASLARETTASGEDDLTLDGNPVADVVLRGDLHVEQSQGQHDLNVHLGAGFGRRVELDDHVRPVGDKPERLPLVREFLDPVAAPVELEPQPVGGDLLAVDLGGEAVHR
jgi:hypothetical protein